MVVADPNVPVLAAVAAAAAAAVVSSASVTSVAVAAHRDDAAAGDRWCGLQRLPRPAAASQDLVLAPLGRRRPS